MADQKLSALSAIPAISDDDLFYVVDDPAGTPIGYKATATQIKAVMLAFGTIAVSGQSNVVAEQFNDTLTFIAGANVILTTSAAGDSVTIAVPFKGAQVTKAANQTTADFTTGTALTWDTEVYDTDGFHEGVTNPSRFTIPAGVTKVNIAASVAISLLTTSVWVNFYLTLNGSSAFVGGVASLVGNANTSGRLNFVQLGLPVTPGDYFEAFLNIQTDTSVTIIAGQSNFTIQAVE